jgi:hypothetical protein
MKICILFIVLFCAAALRAEEVIAELVLQRSVDLVQWENVGSVELFRTENFDPTSLTVRPQWLFIYKDRVDAHTPNQRFSFPVSTEAEKHFFRSYVAVVP